MEILALPGQQGLMEPLDQRELQGRPETQVSRGQLGLRVLQERPVLQVLSEILELAELPETLELQALMV